MLSACNTAAPGGKPSADDLLGLARTFFYAGSRKLLVSHWAVDSAATVKLTTSLFERYGLPATKGRAQALRTAMRVIRNDATEPRYAHPHVLGTIYGCWRRRLEPCDDGCCRSSSIMTAPSRSWLLDDLVYRIFDDAARAGCF